MTKEMPKAYEPQEYEDKIYKNWEESGFFRPETKEKAEKTYTIVLPPPNVTGTLHMGHAGMLAYEDVLIRYHRMNDFRTLWLPGTDHAAIATQTKVEKIIKVEGSSRHELGREKFLERVRSFAQDSHDTIVNQCKKMGASLDWSREAYTLDATREKAVNSVFKMMYDDGLIVRGERVVNWCPRCHSTLADDEVEYKESRSKLYFFKYDKDFPITIATTRPETKLGDTAVAVNPKDERYKDMIGKTYDVDFVGAKLKIKIIADRHVDMEFGAGALGVTPAHSMVDWQMAEENDLNIIKVIDEDGNIKEQFGEYSGKSAKEARNMIIERLQEAGLIESTEEIDNKLSLCYRCDTPIEPLPSLQWFIDVNKKVKRLDGKSIKEVSVAAVREGVFGREKINIVPARFEKTYYNWMENLRDWCISRQIWFGHQVPVWYRTDDRKLTTENREMYCGIEAPEGEGWVRDEATLDTWFSSGLWTFSTLASSPDQIKLEDGKLIIDSEDFRDFHPTQVLETGYDILFFWVARMIIMTTYATQDIPFQDVYLHGLILDEKGKKMSKSKGNVIDPLEMIDKYGTDATRLSLLIGCTPGTDLKINEEKIASFRNLINKIWNISRYILQSGNIKVRSDLSEINFDECTLSDRWIISEMIDLIKSTDENIKKYKFSQTGEDLRDFTWNKLADWYIEASKFDNSLQKEEVLSFVLTNLLKLWHPYIPFITEVIWKEISSSDLIVESWPDYEKIYAEWSKDQSKIETKDFVTIQNIIESIRNARAENKVEPSKKVKTIICAGEKLPLIKQNENLICNLRTGIDKLEILDHCEKIQNEIHIAVEGMDIYLIGAIDREKEAARIKKEIENLEKLITGIKSKLSNEAFVKNAPKEVVSAEKKRLAKFEEELSKLQ